MRALLILSVAFLCGCAGSNIFGGDSGSSNSSSNSAQSEKSLFSDWTNDSNNDPLNLTGGTFDAPMAIVFLIQDGSICQCTAEFVGDNNSGAFANNSCVIQSGTYSQCSSLGGSGTYSISGNELKICSGTTNACITFH